MRKIFNRDNIFLLLLMLLVFGSKANAQNNENGDGGFNWDGMNDLDNVNVGPSGGGGNTPAWDYASNYWDQNPNDYIGSNNDYYNEQYSTGPSNPGYPSGGGSGGAGGVNRQTVSDVALTKSVKPGETHTQDVKMLRDPNKSTNKKVIDLVINGEKVGTVTFFAPLRDANGVDIYSKMTVEVFSNCPIAIASLTPINPETSSYNGDQHSTNGNLENALAELKIYDNFMQMSFNVPINEEEDLVITTSGVPLDTPQAYENALNEAGKGDFKIINGVVKIKADNGTYVLTSDTNVSSPTVLSRVKNLAAILTKSLGGDQKEVYINTEKGEKKSEDNQAWTRKILGATFQTIYLNINGGFNAELNNLNNFKSIIKHELFHVEDNRDENFRSDLSTHADVYVRAANNYTYNTTTDDFKMHNAAAFAKYLLNMAKDSEFSLNDILTKITAFNKNNGGVKILTPSGAFSKATITLRVQYKNVISEPIEYGKIDE
ncbi:hypothetical protein [Flavobacterium sp. KACC 22761]|uniref:hypothetical protein n=1 Tax=Flavobacterium sp. KACC 22761 TaxID=3092665 RepID=UPI002A750CEF|nr:hypothetical protein [Flavobacterium sp. KACC 22761]WPO80743.1 hypothetical protein SCB73_10195 [Flavobacterium sp. KACC 22761]